MNTTMNSVKSLKEQPFYKRTYEEKLLIKSLGRPMPHLNIEQASKGRDRTFKRQFRSSLYEKYPWMCGCEVQNALYCFPCLLYGGKEIWSYTGISSLPHISTLANKHTDNKKHINNVLELGVLGRSSAEFQTSCIYFQETQRHNEQVNKNLSIASQMIDILKTSSSMDLINGKALNLEQILNSLDTLLKDSIKESKLFQEYSRLIQEDLLQCILDVCREKIVEELNKAKYVTVILDDTAAVSSNLYLLVIFRYEVNGELHERFWEIINIEAISSIDILPCILKKLKSVFDSCPNKIIALNFEGPCMMLIPADVLESKIREHFPGANYLFNCGHDFNTLIENAALHNYSARKFLSCLSVFPAFFCSSQRLHLLETMASKRGIYPPPDGWDFRFQTAVLVYQVQAEILECCLELQNSLCSKNVQEARILQYFLEDIEFLFWLDFFHKIMLQMANLHIELQSGQVDAWKLVGEFTSTVHDIINEVSNKWETFSEERKQYKAYNLKKDSQEVCELIVAALRYRLQSTDYSEAYKLLDPTCFIHYSKDFPVKFLNATARIFSDVDNLMLQSELDVIYERTEFRKMEGALAMLQFFYLCNLEESFPETMNLLRRIVILLPVITEYNRSYLVKIIKAFLQNSLVKDQSATLIMLAVEKQMVSSIKDFNKRVLEKLANRDGWRLELTYRR